MSETHVTVVIAQKPPYSCHMNQSLLYELNDLNPAGEYTPPAEILLVQAGEFSARDGTLYRNTQPKKIVSAFRKDGIALAIDLDHRIYLKGGGPAIGWINQIEERNGAIWGTKIEWLDTAIYRLKYREYRYYSPHYGVDPQSREILRLDVVSLVNRPRIAVDALNQLENKEINMNPQDELNAALKDNAKHVKEAMEAQAQTVALQTELNAAKKELETLKGEIKQFKDKDAQAESEKLKSELNSFLEDQVKEGKMPPAQKAMYEKVIRSEDELNALKETLKDAPVVLPQGTKDKGKAPLDNEINALLPEGVTLDEMNSMDISAEDIKKFAPKD